MVALTLATTFPSVVGGHSSYNSSGLPPEKLAEEMFSYANHQLLESVFFPGNTLSPSYVQVTYSFKNSCTPQPDLCDENNKDDIWLWSYSPVYLVFHPESLNALALTIIGPKLLPSKVKGSVTKTVFNSIRGGGRMCLCLDEKYENIKHDVEKLRNLTAMLYGFASVRNQSYATLEDMWYAILEREIRMTNFNISPGNTTLPTLIYVFTILSNLSLNFVLIPLTAYVCQSMLKKIGEVPQTSILFYSSLWWAAVCGSMAAIIIFILQNYLGLCWVGSNCEHQSIFTLPMLSTLFRMVIPMLGYIVAMAVSLRNIDRRRYTFPLFPFCLALFVTLVQHIHNRTGKVIHTGVTYFGIWIILFAFHLLCSQLQFAIMASFDNPFRVFASISFNVGLFLIAVLVMVNILMADLMTTDVLFRRTLRNIRTYLTQTFQFMQITFSISLFYVWLFAFSYLGIHQRNEFVDGVQTVLEFFTVPITIGILGYAVKNTVYKMNEMVGPN